MMSDRKTPIEEGKSKRISTRPSRQEGGKDETGEMVSVRVK